MASWHSKELGDGVEANKPTREIQKAFLTLTIARRYSSDAAVFSRYDLETNVVTIYFTPSAELLAKKFGAVPCEKPIPKKGFSLIAGDDSTWEAHFPGYRAGLRSSRGK